MSLFKKKEKEPLEPQYYTSATNEQVLNYNVYYLSASEKIINYTVIFLIGAVTGWVLYGNLFMREGELTLLSHISNAVVCTLFGFIATKIIVPLRIVSLRDKRQNKLKLQFRDMLAAISTALLAGDNTRGAFESAYRELTSQYGEDSYISNELRQIVTGVNNNVSLDELLSDFANRSGLEDVKDFANVYTICNQKGGDLKRVVRNTYDLIGEKTSISEEIKTKLTSNKTQQNVMSIVPFFLIGFLRVSSSSFAESFASPTGVLTMTVAVGIFIGSFIYGRKIIDIKG